MSALLFRIPGLLLLAAGFQRKRNPGRFEDPGKNRFEGLEHSCDASVELILWTWRGVIHSTERAHDEAGSPCNNWRALLSMKGRVPHAGKSSWGIAAWKHASDGWNLSNRQLYIIIYWWYWWLLVSCLWGHFRCYSKGYLKIPTTHAHMIQLWVQRASCRRQDLNKPSSTGSGQRMREGARWSNSWSSYTCWTGFGDYFDRCSIPRFIPIFLKDHSLILIYPYFSTLNHH